MARKVKPAKPRAKVKTVKSRRNNKRPPKPAWWNTALDYLGNYILLTLAIGLILWLALIFRDALDWLI